MFNKWCYKGFCFYSSIFFSFPSNYQSILYRSSFGKISKVIGSYDPGQDLSIWGKCLNRIKYWLFGEIREAKKKKKCFYQILGNDILSHDLKAAPINPDFNELLCYIGFREIFFIKSEFYMLLFHCFCLKYFRESLIGIDGLSFRQPVHSFSQN